VGLGLVGPEHHRHVHPMEVVGLAAAQGLKSPVVGSAGGADDL
jgi:hypothetical protein